MSAQKGYPEGAWGNGSRDYAPVSLARHGEVSLRVLHPSDISAVCAPERLSKAAQHSLCLDGCEWPINPNGRVVGAEDNWMGQGVRTVGDCVERLTYDADSLYRVEAARVSMASITVPDAWTVAVQRVAQWRDDDGELSVERFMRDDDAPFRRRVRQKVRKPLTLAIGCGLSIKAGADAERVSWRGAALIVLADLLESAGVRCEVLGFNVCTEAGKTALVVVKAKESGEHLDISAMACTLASASTYRQFLIPSVLLARSTFHGGGRPVDERGARTLLQAVRSSTSPIADVLPPCIIIDDCFDAYTAQRSAEKAIAEVSALLAMTETAGAA